MRFPRRLSKEAMTKPTTEVLNEFTKRGLNIIEAIAVDARLVKSASMPINNDDLRKLKEERNNA